ncbi:hypothetical protein UY3_17538 [Chelonia mydas]|uniref:Uncharacterized protein n=1 Tax=Chelonia mydas TaxID=8469 RepID=M7ARD2_CHEMY|nr:hypothetical protein UY3_17538 [Chelonia mydas]
MDRLGHQLEDMLLSCKYRGELCGPQNFSALLSGHLTDTKRQQDLAHGLGPTELRNCCFSTVTTEIKVATIALTISGLVTSLQVGSKSTAC